MNGRLLPVVAAFTLGLAADARAGTTTLQHNEVVLVLDTSASMNANDPERGAVLGAMILEALTRDSSDALTVIPFAPMGTDPPLLRGDPARLQALEYDVSGTYYRRPLHLASEVFAKAPPGSTRTLLFFTDGAPGGEPALSGGPPVPFDLREMRSLPGLDADPNIIAIPIGLSADKTSKSLPDRTMGAQVLSELAPFQPDDYLDQGYKIVPAFTEGYARALGSRPETGALQPGQTKTISVGKYVTEVLVVTTSERAGLGAYDAKLTGPTGAAAPRTGVNCGPPPPGFLSNCDAQKRHFVAFRTPSDPDVASTWTLGLAANAPSPIQYGVILRYDLAAELGIPAITLEGDGAELDAHLSFRGRPFDDQAFFTKDGFTVSAEVDGQIVTLTPKGASFKGTWTAPKGKAGAVAKAKVTFRNNWLQRTAQATTRIEAPPKLELFVRPNPIDLGSWRGERGRTVRCQELDLSGSTNADRVPITCTPANAPGEGRITCEPVAGSEAKLTQGAGQPMRWRVCAEMSSCCGDALGQAQVTLRGRDAAYATSAAVVPVRFTVTRTGWLRCWWPYLATAAGLAFLVWFILGWTRPYSFEPSLAVKLGASEKDLMRAAPHVLRERTGGKRGFYRNAQMAITGDGSFVQAKRGLLLLEAGRAGATRFVRAPGLERKDRRTAKWAAMTQDDLVAGCVPGETYRIGKLYIRWT